MMYSVCPHDCPSACALTVAVENGRLTEVSGDPEHPFTQGLICGKVRAYAERVHSPSRVGQPLRRVGPKGAGAFGPISWDAALDEIAERWRRIIDTDGAEAILPFSYAGTMGQVQYYAGHPLFHALGASRLDRTICVSTAYAGWRATVGSVDGNDSEQMVGADLVVRERQRPPTVLIAPTDATSRGIGDGEAVQVFNDRGSARFAACVTDRTRPGVVVIEGIWWHRFHPGGRGVNVLTSDRVTDMGGGPAFHSNLVEVAPAGQLCQPE